MNDLDSILSGCNLARKDLEVVCTKSCRNKIALKIGDWKSVASLLDFCRDEIDTIDGANLTQEQKKLALFDRWGEKYGKQATFIKLAEVFHDLGRRDFIEKLCELIKSSQTECAETESTPPKRTSVLEQASQTHEENQVPLQQPPASIDEMQRNFGSVVSKTMKSLELAVTTKQFASSLLALGAYEPVMKKEQALLEDHEDKIFQAETISDIYRIIRPYMSFFNPELLQYIIETHGSKENDVDFREYMIKLDMFCQSIVVPPVDLSNEEQSPILDRREEIKIKLDLNDRRLQRLRDVKSAVAKILQVKEVALCLVSLKEGCTELIFMVPHFVIDYVFPLSEEQLKAISLLGAFKLTTTQDNTYDFKKPLPDAVEHDKSKGASLSSVDAQDDIKIFVETLTKDTISLKAKPSSTIKSIKDKIESERKIPVDQQQLAFAKRRLDDDHTLSYYNVQNGSVLYLTLKLRGVMQLFVKTPTGKVVALEVEYTDSIKTLKSKIHEKEGTPPDEQQLTFYGRLLEDSYTMSHYRLRNESTVHLVSKPRGKRNIRIQLKRLTGKTITLEVDPMESIGNVKAKIEDEEHISPDEQRLILKGKELDDSYTLDYYNIHEGSQVYLVFKSTDNIEIDVICKERSSLGVFSIKAKPSSTIKSVKAKIENEMRIPSDQLKLAFHSNTQLRDEYTLSDYNIQNGSVLYLTLKLRGFTQIFVKTIAGKMVALEVEDKDSIETIKRKIHEKEGTPPDEQQLVFDGQRLEDRCTISHYKLQNESTVHLVPKLRGKRNIRIQLKSLTGKTITLEVDPMESIGNVKATIEDEEDIPAEEQRLITQGKELDDSYTLDYYNIREGSQVYLLSRLTMKKEEKIESEIQKEHLLKMHVHEAKMTEADQQLKIAELEHEMMILDLQIKSLQFEKNTIQKKIDYHKKEKQKLCDGIEPLEVPFYNLEVCDEVGSGRWGTVSEGKWTVSVKRFNPSDNKMILARQQREMEMSDLAQHPNIVRFIAAAYDERGNYYPYIITELLDMSLRRAYQLKKLEEKHLVSVFQDTANGLAYLHGLAVPIIHCSVSSENIHLKRQPNGSWQAKLSGLTSPNFEEEAEEKNICYCAPETSQIIEDCKSLSPKIDVYSYGIMLCEVITTQFPNKEILPSMFQQTLKLWPQMYPLIVSCINHNPDLRPFMPEVLSTLKTIPI